ncbi:hypothetical protein HOP50_01g07440 [Chloropicon primus]|uniref:IPT/TIG domain-containing protein n=1 Tax=Chloropicon primus TaxID=1764295 RepID=A0A5B8MFY7_9CHLO|nr:hypothetical protein A3770_01p07600 [Chloropicon primus]UPQ97453.1 hypothetical protein HOP50_01g07440 [Chloropicon primus]|eukprot:QDZ18242.1 hypothetical protein A3770_01p07600 [Chloropicon primus]
MATTARGVILALAFWCLSSVVAAVMAPVVDFEKPYEIELVMPGVGDSGADMNVTVIGGYTFEDGERGGLLSFEDGSKSIVTYVVDCTDETVVRHAVIRVPSEGGCTTAKINARPGKYDVFKALACRGTERGRRPESSGAIEPGTMATEDSLSGANDLLGGAMTIKKVSQLTPEEAQSPLVRCS